MQIQKKLLIALAILTLFVAVTGILGILYTTSINEKLKVVTSKTNPTVETVDDLIINIWKSAKTTEEFSSARSAEELSALEKKFESSRSNFVKIKEIAYNLINEPALRGKLDDAVEKYTLFTEKAYDVLYLSQETINGRTPDAAEQLSVLTRGAASYTDEAANILEEVSVRVYATNKIANEESFRAVSTTKTTLVLTTLLSMICAALIGIYLSRSIITPLNHLSEAATQLSKGDFEVAVPEPKRNDELTHLIRVFNNMVISVGRMIKRSPDLKRYLTLEENKQEKFEYVLEPGTSYLFKGASSTPVFEIAAEKLKKGDRVLCIARQSPEVITQTYNLQKARCIWLKETKDKVHETASNLPTLSKVIADFIGKNEPSLILLDRIDYLITQYGFAEVLKFITHLNDLIMASKASLVVPLDPSFMNERNLSFLEKELKELSFSSSKQQQLPDDVKNILAFIKNRAVLGKTTSFKDISKEFNITAPTTQKKILDLESRGLIRVSKQGRSKLLYPFH